MPSSRGMDKCRIYAQWSTTVPQKGKAESSEGKWVHPETEILGEIKWTASFNVTWGLLFEKPKI